MADNSCSEFDLHIWKRAGICGRPDVYTIGVWDGQQIRSLCHIAPIEAALATLRQVLENAGHAAPVPQRMKATPSQTL
jgi:hypothetical protein